jgi:hypothetical protein
MSLDHVLEDMSTVQLGYHRLTASELDAKDDAESLFELGDRWIAGIDCDVNVELGTLCFAQVDAKSMRS